MCSVDSGNKQRAAELLSSLKNTVSVRRDSGVIGTVE